jgi:YbbR domain-containing protein
MRPWLGSALLKLVALFLAFVVWLAVSAPRRERVSERALAAPLSLVGIPRDMIITTPVPTTVSVRLRGRSSIVRSLTSQTLEVTVELSWAQPGEATITLRPEAIAVPEGVEVISLEPNKVQFRVEPLRQRSLPIRPFLVGEPPPGYFTGEATLDPERALVSGPASRILAMNEVATERVIMTGRTATFVQSVPVVSDSPLVRIVSPLSTLVTVPVLAEIGPNQPATDTSAATETTGTAASAATDSQERKRKTQ